MTDSRVKSGQHADEIAALRRQMDEIQQRLEELSASEITAEDAYSTSSSSEESISLESVNTVDTEKAAEAKAEVEVTESAESSTQTAEADEAAEPTQAAETTESNEPTQAAETTEPKEPTQAAEPLETANTVKLETPESDGSEKTAKITEPDEHGQTAGIAEPSENGQTAEFIEASVISETTKTSSEDTAQAEVDHQASSTTPHVYADQQPNDSAASASSSSPFVSEQSATTQSQSQSGSAQTFNAGHMPHTEQTDYTQQTTSYQAAPDQFASGQPSGGANGPSVNAQSAAQQPGGTSSYQSAQGQTQQTSQSQNPYEGAYAGQQVPFEHNNAHQQYYQQAQQAYYWYGEQQNKAHQAPTERTKDHVAAGLLGVFLGMFGIHKFYLGYNTSGFIMLGVAVIGGLLTFSLAAIAMWLIGLIEGIIYLVKDQAEFEQTYVFNKREWF